MPEIKTIVVLGMHRSATSLAAKGLHDAGVFIGDDLLPASPHNPWGYFEERKFVHLNDIILHAAGGRWDNPPPEDEILALADRFGPDIKALVEYCEARVNPDYPLWGWKDPRTTLTIKLYMPYLSNPHFITCFRNPVDIAASLQKRDGMPFGDGVMLANEYNRRLVEFLSVTHGLQ